MSNTDKVSWMIEKVNVGISDEVHREVSKVRLDYTSKVNRIRAAHDVYQRLWDELIPRYQGAPWEVCPNTPPDGMQVFRVPFIVDKRLRAGEWVVDREPVGLPMRWEQEDQDETEYLLGSQRNAKRLYDSLNEARH